MKDLKSTILLVLCLLMSCVGYTQVLADIEGDVKIRGNIDINHYDDTTAVYIGRNAGISHDPIFPANNTFVGSNAGRSNTSGRSNSFFGELAGRDNTTGSFNSFFGRGAGAFNSSGHSNSFFGDFAGLFNTEGIANSFYGYNAGKENITGSDNSFFGNRTGEFNSTGRENSFFGSSAGLQNTKGIGNSFFGAASGRNNTTGDNNAFFGIGSGQENTKGEDNAFFGKDAGRQNTTGIKNTYIGSLADQMTAGDSLDRAIAIGHSAKVNCHNCAVIGGTGDNKVRVGINTADPVSQLTIKQATGGDSSGIRLIANTTNRSWEIRHTNVGDNLRFVALADDGVSRVRTVDIQRIDGAYMVVSDQRLKRDIVYFDDVLKDIVKIKPASYHWKNQPTHSKPSLGVIAQELEALFPTAVSTNEDGYKMVNYDALGVLAIQAIKDQQEMIEALGAEVDRLNKQNSQMSKRLKIIEDLLKP